MQFNPASLAALATAMLVVVAVRWAFIKVSAGSAVDHFYWILAARAYRTQPGLPVRIPDKFLLEDERQFYPPGFGRLLGLFPEWLLRSPLSLSIMLVVDAATLLMLVAFGIAFSLPITSIIAICIVYGLAPVLVAYNTQLTSRGMGNLFVVVMLLAEVAAISTDGTRAALFWSIAVAGSAGVILTHKMTTQFMIALWPFWSFALGNGDFVWMAALVPVLGLAGAVLLTGPRFQLLQWAAHFDIVAFWHRNWRYLGAHQFRQSPVYGDSGAVGLGAFHQPGWSGLVRHIALVTGYLPAALVLPVMLLFAPAPPLWLITWLGIAYLVALATLVVPPLRCLGGGHLYIFNAVPATALWWAYLLAAPTVTVVAGFAIAMLATAVSLAIGWRQRRKRLRHDEDAFDAVIQRLNGIPRTRIATYPVTASERIALETDHSVFWGAHGLGFRTLEPHFPVVRVPVRKALAEWRVSYALLDTVWWPEGESILGGELGDRAPQRFGRWLLYIVATDDRSTISVEAAV